MLCHHLIEGLADCSGEVEEPLPADGRPPEPQRLASLSTLTATRLFGGRERSASVAGPLKHSQTGSRHFCITSVVLTHQRNRAQHSCLRMRFMETGAMLNLLTQWTCIRTRNVGDRATGCLPGVAFSSGLMSVVRISLRGLHGPERPTPLSERGQTLGDASRHGLRGPDRSQSDHHWWIAGALPQC